MRSSEQSTPSVSFIRMWTEISSLRWTTLRSLPETLKMIPLGLSSWCSEMFNRCSQLFSSVSESIELWPIFSEKCDWNTIGGQFVSEAHASQENLPAALCQTCFGSCLFVCFFSEVSNKDREKSRFYCRLFLSPCLWINSVFFFLNCRRKENGHYHIYEISQYFFMFSHVYQYIDIFLRVTLLFLVFKLNDLTKAIFLPF